MCYAFQLEFLVYLKNLYILVNKIKRNKYATNLIP